MINLSSLNLNWRAWLEFERRKQNNKEAEKALIKSMNNIWKIVLGSIK